MRMTQRTGALSALGAIMAAALAVATPDTAEAQAFGPDTCRRGFVWREAIPSDHVCVPPAVRELVRRENALAASRRNPTGPFGSDTCIAGFVWREAFPGDRVCVTPARRAATHQENRLAASRRAAERVAPPLAFGPDTCRQGFVWREAIPSDHVCVPPAVRELVRRENALAASRRNPTGRFGSDTCIAGFVWREAFPGDRVCVTPARRSATRQENRLAASRRAS